MTAAAIAVTAGCLLATGAAIGAPGQPKPKQVAAKLCQAEKRADKAAFKATYGKRAMRECKRAQRSEAADEVRSASQQCRADAEADPDAFAAQWGGGPNAHGKCVSATVREQADEAVDEFKNAAKACRAEREADPEAFAEQYGSNANQRNAFGKCVSQTVRDGDDGDDGEPTPV